MTDFEKKVLNAVLAIPLGETRSYREIAVAAGRPKACRAVANILANNEFPILIPCHRVVKKDGSAGGYSGGPENKIKLIKIEKKIKDMLK